MKIKTRYGTSEIKKGSHIDYYDATEKDSHYSKVNRVSRSGKIFVRKVGKVIEVKAIQIIDSKNKVEGIV